MINLCFLNGKVVNKIDLKFVYNSQKRSLEKNILLLPKLS